MSDRVLDAVMIAAVGLVVLPLGLVVGCCAGLAVRDEPTSAAFDVTPLEVARAADGRTIFTAQVVRRDELHWTSFHVVSAALANGTPLELLSSYATQGIPEQFALAFATPAGASVPERPVLRLHTSVLAERSFDGTFYSGSQRTLVFVR